MTMPNVGDVAPQFELEDQDGKKHRLADYAGKNVVLYFYPKDDTPGCTVEACAFRDDHSKLQAAGAVVLGVSPDDTKSHRKFADKFNLPFPLLADTDHKLADAYGAWGEKSLYGRKFMGILRATFLIAPDGKLKSVWPKVKVDGHSAEVLAAITGEAPAAAAAPELKPAAKKASARKTVASNTSGKRSSAKPLGAAKSPAKKAPAKKAPGRSAPPKKAPGTKAPAKKAAPMKKGPAKKAPGKSTPAKKAPGTKAPAKKAPGKKAPAKKAAPAKKGPAKKAPGKSTPAKKAPGKKAPAIKASR